jgi:hypothetical protein
MPGNFCGFPAGFKVGKRFLVFLTNRRVKKVLDDRQRHEALIASDAMNLKIELFRRRTGIEYVSDHQISYGLRVRVFTGFGDVQYIPRFPVVGEQVKA